MKYVINLLGLALYVGIVGLVIGVLFAAGLRYPEWLEKLLSRLSR